MNGKMRGNFVVISGLIVALCVGLVSFWAWNLQGEEAAPQKPTIVSGSGKPAILGPALEEAKVDSAVVRTLGQNSAVVEYEDGETTAAAEATGEVPVPAQVASSTEKGKWIYVDKAGFRLYLAEGNNVLNSWGIAPGKVTGNKRKAGDNRTPEGSFTVQQIQNASSWSHDFKDGKGVIKGAYGPWFIRLKAGGWKGIGIHGTHDPDSIGTLATEGCIRMKNEDVEALKPSVTVGMKVVIGPNGTKEDEAAAKASTKSTAKKSTAAKSTKSSTSTKRSSSKSSAKTSTKSSKSSSSSSSRKKSKNK